MPQHDPFESGIHAAMPKPDVDLFVIGGGSGGVRAARIAATHGAKVMLAEEFRLGGTCVVRGCVPKKLFVNASRFGDLFDDAGAFGWTVPDAKFDWPSLVDATEREISRLETLYRRSQEQAGVDVVRSRAVIEDAHTVRILAEDRVVRAGTILVATGAVPALPSFEGIGLGITSNEVFGLPRFPKRLVIGGAGYIALEFAGLFAGLGSEVTIVCRGSNVLTGFDEDIRTAVADAYRARGVTLLLEDTISCMSSPGVGSDGRRTPNAHIDVFTAMGARLVADEVILAFGRIPNTSGLGLERVGVAIDGDGAIMVDAMSRTNVPSIYAVGDVTNRFNLTPVAIREGHAFADSVFGDNPWQVEYDLIPTAVFSTPEVATVGLTEQEAVDAYPAVDVYKVAFRPLIAIDPADNRRALIKVVVDADTDRVVGVHLFLDDASEMIQLVAVAMRAGLSKRQLANAMGVHPTLGEELLALRTPTLQYRAKVPLVPA
jgi:glutathione reductase (NADPH)